MLIRKVIVGPIISLLVLIALPLSIEATAYLINRQSGEPTPFLFPPDRFQKSAPPAFEVGAGYHTFDPHLGYSRSEDSYQRYGDFKKLILPGFLAYGIESLDAAPRPLIVTLGGSTTDPVLFGHSWPEELWRLMADRGVSGTVINGGIGGYSSSQELLKLIRDVVELKPDIVISYSGINDFNTWSPLPHPMAHPFHRQVAESIIDRTLNPSPFMPSTVTLLQRLVFAKDNGELSAFTLGLPTQRSQGEFLLRNLDLMHSVCEGAGIQFVSILQPVLGGGRYSMNAAEEARMVELGADYNKRLLETYAVVKNGMTTRKWLHDFTDVFAESSAVYQPDGRHLTKEANRFVGAQVLALLVSKERK